MINSEDISRLLSSAKIRKDSIPINKKWLMNKVEELQLVTIVLNSIIDELNTLDIEDCNE